MVGPCMNCVNPIATQSGYCLQCREPLTARHRLFPKDIAIKTVVAVCVVWLAWMAFA
jgi:hypothetical protein